MIIKVTESSGHTACPGRTGGLGTELDVQVTDGDLDHIVRVHILDVEYSVGLKDIVITLFRQDSLISSMVILLGHYIHNGYIIMTR